MQGFLNKLAEGEGVEARFIERIAGVKVDTDRLATVARLEPAHRLAVEEMGFKWSRLWRAEQVHGADIAVVKSGRLAADNSQLITNVDGLLTADADVLLGIYVADCGVLYLHDHGTGAIGLLHSGKKGTELEILPRALEMMSREFGTDAADVVVALAPCIRPPAYDVDFATQIRMQALAAGVRLDNFIDSEVCTSSDLERYYSYRIEQGSTGRMLALLGKKS